MPALIFLSEVFGNTAQARATSAVFAILIVAGALLFVEGLDRMATAASVPAFAVAALVTFAGGALVRIGATTPY